MEKITYTYSHDHANDTTIELTRCPGRTEIEIDFNHEDPNVGLEIAVFGTDADEDFFELANEWHKEINAFIDGDKSEAKVYEEYTSNMWYCIENSLQWLIDEHLRKNMPVFNKAGNEIRIIPLHEAAKIVKDEMSKYDNVRFDFGIGVDGRKVEDFIDPDNADLLWYGVKLLPNDINLFDGQGCYETDYIFICGHWGGGNITMAYYCDDLSAGIDEQDPDAKYLLKAMMECCGVLNPNEIVLLEKIQSQETCLHDDNSKEAK